MKNTVTKIIESAVKIKKEYDSCHIAAYSAKGAYFILLSAVPMILILVMIMAIIQPFDVLGINNVITDYISESDLLQNILKELSLQSTVSAISVTSAF